MAVEIDIFNPQISVVSKGLEGKVFMFYGSNNLGKTYVAARMPKPYFVSCESGLNGTSGAKYGRVTNWQQIMKILKQFTDPKTVDRAKEMYSTIIIDGVDSLGLFCQDYICSVHGDGAATLGDNADPRKNLYQLYEKEMHRFINKLLSCGYTIVFVDHEQEKDGFISPKGDKRLLSPIVNNTDFTVYLSSNGVDEDGNVVLSTAHFAQTESFFARSRFTKCVTSVSPFSIETLKEVVKNAVEAEEAESGIAAVSYDEQKAMNETKEYDFDEIVEALRELGGRYDDNEKVDEWQEKVEEILGKGKTVSSCNKKQLQALVILYDELISLAEDLGI